MIPHPRVRLPPVDYTKPTKRACASPAFHASSRLDMIVRGAVHLNAGTAIRRCGDTRYKIPRTVEKEDAVRFKSLHETRTLNRFILLITDKDAALTDDAAALASGRGITLPGDCESIQIEREPRRAELYTRRRIDCAGHIAGEPCVLTDHPRRGDRAADGFFQTGLWRRRYTGKRRNG